MFPQTQKVFETLFEGQKFFIAQNKVFHIIHSLFRCSTAGKIMIQKNGPFTYSDFECAEELTITVSKVGG